MGLWSMGGWTARRIERSFEALHRLRNFEPPVYPGAPSLSSIKPAEIRLALLKERRECFLRLGCGQHVGEMFRLCCHLRADFASLSALHQRLRSLQRCRR